MQLSKTHESDLPLGGTVYHCLDRVKIFGRERDPKTGIVSHYWVVNHSGTRYKVHANKLQL
jgi:hypothetical protein